MDPLLLSPKVYLYYFWPVSTSSTKLQTPFPSEHSLSSSAIHFPDFLCKIVGMQFLWGLVDEAAWKTELERLINFQNIFLFVTLHSELPFPRILPLNHSFHRFATKNIKIRYFMFPWRGCSTWNSRNIPIFSIFYINPIRHLIQTRMFARCSLT